LVCVHDALPKSTTMRILLLVCFVSSTLTCAHSQIVQIIAEPFAQHDTTGIADLEGMTTYRIYAEMTNVDDELSAIFGDSESPLHISSTTGFYNNTLGSDLGWEVNPALLAFFPLVNYDSWLTIGASNSAEGANMGNTIGMESAFESFNSNGAFIVDDFIGGSIFTLAGDPAAAAGEDFRVLIAQLTTSGTIESSLNMQMFVNGLQSQNSVVQNATIVFPIGCNDLSACNYTSDATDSSTCTYPLDCEDCSGNCIDANDDGICDCNEPEITPGCTQADADNYSPEATTDDGSCVIGGCTYISAYNYDPLATYDAGNCSFPGCTNPIALNYDSNAEADNGECLVLGCMDPLGYDFNPVANVPGICEFPAPCVSDIDGDGAVDVFDLLIFFESYGQPCQ